jgi:hypothetical protein
VRTPSSFTIVLTESMAFADGSRASTRGMTSSLNGIETAQPRIPSPRRPAMAAGRSVVVKAL